MFLGVFGVCEAGLWVILGNEMMRGKRMAARGNGILGSGFRTGFGRTVIKDRRNVITEDM